MLNDEILKLINDNLPNLQVETFRNFIDESEKNKKQITKLENEYQNLKANYDKVLKESKDLSNVNINLHSQIDDLKVQIISQQELEIRERNLELDILKNQLSNEQNNKRDLFNLVQTVFRNPNRVTRINEDVVTTHQTTSYNYDGKPTGSGSFTNVTPIQKTLIELEE